MNCPNCGNVVTPGKPFCGACGMRLIAERPVQVEEQPAHVAEAPAAALAPPVAPVTPAVRPYEIPTGFAVGANPFITGPRPTPEPTPKATPMSAPADEETRVVPRVTAPKLWRLVLADQSVVTVDGSLLLGRDPAANPNWPAAALLPVVDPAGTISKTHAVFEVDHNDRLWVTDLHSSNGVTVVQPSGAAQDLVPDVAAAVETGAEIELGTYTVHIRKD